MELKKKLQSGRRLEFWYEFASTYSYLSVMRITELAATAGVEVIWRPFLLGPIFKTQGWNDSPFNLYPAKGRYMIRDMQRQCAARALPFKMPQKFPANGLMAARIAVAGVPDGWVGDFSRAVFIAQFTEGADISDATVINRVLQGLGLDVPEILALSRQDSIKEQLRKQTNQARELGIFGAPTFMTEDGELFWGDDRLEQALNWPVTL